MAMDSNSPPVSMAAAPKRLRKISRTAGTKDEPPVRNTLSMSPAARFALARASSTAVSMAASSRAIQRSKSALAMSASMVSSPASSRKCAAGWLDSVSLAAETAW